MRSDVELFDGLEFVSAEEFRHSMVIVNYKLTRDIPMGEYRDMLSRLRDSWLKSGYKTVHVCVNRKSQTPKTLSEKQCIGRILRDRRIFYTNIKVNKPSINTNKQLMEIRNQIEVL